MVQILQKANDQIEATNAIGEAGAAVQQAFNQTAGRAYEMTVRLGMAEPSFTSVSESLKVLLSNAMLKDFETARNGLGLNNVLYISMLMEYFERRVAAARAAGQLLLIEEPEAHLHPQLQRVLYAVLRAKPFQTILTTHSTHITSQAPLPSTIVLTNEATGSTYASSFGEGEGLEPTDVADLERHLDATRSALLFARRVILVEGPAELFLIPVLVKRVMGIDLDRLGISVVPIYGVHFSAYAKLFGGSEMPKRCAIVADGDLDPDDGCPVDGAEDQPLEKPDLDGLANDHLHVFRCNTTFERELALRGTLDLLAVAADDCGAPRAAQRLREALSALMAGELGEDEVASWLNAAGTTVLNTAKRVGKARFAQIAARHAHLGACPAKAGQAG